MKALKLFRVTRYSRKYTWLRWEAYGTQKRGLSMRIETERFKKEWCMCAKTDGLEESFYFRLNQFTKTP